MIRPVILALCCFASSGFGQDSAVSGTGAMLRALDKVNGKAIDVEIYSGGGRAVFGLEVDLADCRYPEDNASGEAYAYLTIREDAGAEPIFDGWMVASAPALNALDHARYDLWVLRCITS